jgi:hypothetical protein
MSAAADADRREMLSRREWWTTSEAAFMLGVDKSTITRWAAGGLQHDRGFDHLGRERIVVNAEAARTRRWGPPDTPEND